MMEFCGQILLLWIIKNLPQTAIIYQKIKKHYLPPSKKLSKELIQAQLDILKPDFVLFVGGMTSVSARREYFPNLKGDGKSIIDGLPILCLEKFMFDGQEKPICYRTYHPSYFESNAQKGLETLIDILPAKSK